MFETIFVILFAFIAKSFFVAPQPTSKSQVEVQDKNEKSDNQTASNVEHDATTEKPDIADDQELFDKLRESLPDMPSFLNVMVGKRIFRLEQITDDVVRIRECLKDVVGQIRYSDCRFADGTLYSVSGDMLWNEK